MALHHSDPIPNTMCFCSPLHMAAGIGSSSVGVCWGNYNQKTTSGQKLLPGRMQSKTGQTSKLRQHSTLC